MRCLALPEEGHFLVGFRSANNAVAGMAEPIAGKPTPDDRVRVTR